eukprot:9803781-Alexandrium_andersonii.AAC.1
MSASLVGSEMCIRDRLCQPRPGQSPQVRGEGRGGQKGVLARTEWGPLTCLLYTSDAADDM